MRQDAQRRREAPDRRTSEHGHKRVDESHHKGTLRDDLAAVNQELRKKSINLPQSAITNPPPRSSSPGKSEGFTQRRRRVPGCRRHCPWPTVEVQLDMAIECRSRGRSSEGFA